MGFIFLIVIYVSFRLLCYAERSFNGREFQQSSYEIHDGDASDVTNRGDSADPFHTIFGVVDDNYDDGFSKQAIIEDNFSDSAYEIEVKFPYFSFTLTNLTLPYPSCPPNATYRIDDNYALRSLYNSTQGYNWKINYGWNISSTSNHPCKEKWFGVTCTYYCPSIEGIINYQDCECAVTSLSLPQNNLDGMLPPEIQFLVRLQQLQLPKNYIFGEIPSVVGLLTDLIVFDLGNNKLMSIIPTELGYLSNLKFLNLKSQSLHGYLPSEIYTLTRLQYLDLCDNWGIVGNISSAIRQLKDLKLFRIFHNFLTGNIPTELQYLVNLRCLDIGSNLITGTLPSEIKYMTSLYGLWANSNFLTGKIITEISELKHLSYLGLYSNYFTNSIPTQIGSMTLLNVFDAHRNNLNNSIPTEFGNMVELRVLVLSTNYLSGPVPSELMTLHLLADITLYDNLLSGCIPSDIWRLQRLRLLDLSYNMFKCQIPSTLVTLTGLAKVSLSYNSFSGEIPDSLYHLPFLQVFDVSYNNLTGPIAKSIDYNNNFHFIGLQHNRLSGSIPSFVSHLVNLQVLILFENKLTGIIPIEMSYLVSLSSLSLAGNMFNGTISSTLFANLTKMDTLDLSSNFFTGPIPDSIMHLTCLQLLNIGNNSFDGQISSRFISNLVNLQYFLVGGNKFSGSLPIDVHKLSHLVGFDVSSNRFSGSIENLFNSISPLSFVALSNNYFTGSVPSIIFNSFNWNLSSFSVAVNCFTPQIPDSICLSRNLQYLNFDGMNSACRKRIQQKSSIPECLFDLRNLTTLHLSGNSFEGQLSQNLTFGKLEVLDLSHNSLRGILPQTIINHRWGTLNLGFNKIGGKLPSDITARSISLQVNRLSYKIPFSFQNISTVSILSGNMFQCDLDRSSLPPDDPNFDSYQCGSDSTNISFYVFLVIYFLIGCVGGLIYGRIASCNNSGTIFSYSIQQINTSAVVMMVLSILGVILAYMLHLRYSMYSYMYAWKFSFAYLSGVGPAIVLIIYIAIFCLTIFIWFTAPTDSIAAEEVITDRRELFATFASSSTTDSTSSSVREIIKKFDYFGTAMLVLYFILNAIFTVTLNILYILHLKNLSGTNLLIVQISLAIFKTLYQWVPETIKKFVEYRLSCCYAYRDIWRKIASVDNRIILNLFSIMIAPCLAASIADSNCFHYFFFFADEVQSTYQSSSVDSYSFENMIRLHKDYFSLSVSALE